MNIMVCSEGFAEAGGELVATVPDFREFRDVKADILIVRLILQDLCNGMPALGFIPRACI